METWLLLQHGAGQPAFNMAVDEALLRTAENRRLPLLRLYGWDRPAVSFGYFQDYPAHLASRYSLVRRPTGGGIVYHTADTTYTVVVPPSHPLHRLRTQQAYNTLHRVIAVALDSELLTAAAESPRGQYECFQRPVAGDVVAGGTKIAGGAQRRSRAGMLHQGSIASRISIARLLAAFRQVLDVTFQPYELTPAERQLAERLTREKYDTATWNQHRRISQPVGSISTPA